MELWIKLALYLVPMYVTNGSAVLFAGPTRLDFGKNFIDGKPWLGSGKTVQGTVLSLLAGIASAALIEATIPGITHELTPRYLDLGILLCAGTHVGDLVASFIKRRLGLQSGKEVLLLDQLDFVAGAVVLGAIVYTPTLMEIGIIAIVTLMAHRLANWTAFQLRLKKVPW